MVSQNHKYSPSQVVPANSFVPSIKSYLKFFAFIVSLVGVVVQAPEVELKWNKSVGKPHLITI